MCGESMLREERKEIIPISGTSQTVTRVAREWVCQECDYFEEAEDERSRPTS
jgi:acetone carboxylase gamma subunit